MKAIDIRTEYLTNPIGIEKTIPRITWLLDSCNRQIGYRIFGTIGNNSFDTGLIRSNNMYHDLEISLEDKDIVKFQIELLDTNDFLECSEENSFEVGLNKFEYGKLISGNYKAKKGVRYSVDYFKKDFNCKKVIKARLYISALGMFYAYINEVPVSNEVFNPGFTDYNKKIRISSFDVTKLINEGSNTLKVELGDGWYRGSIGAKGRVNTYGIRSGFISELHLLFEDGTEEIIPSDFTFKWSNDGPVLLGDLKDGEIVNLNKTPSYSGDSVEIMNKYNFQSLTRPSILEQESFSYIDVIKHEDSMVYVFPQNLAGYFYIKCKKTTSDSIRVLMGEMIDSYNHVSLANIQLKHKGQLTPKQECIINLKEGINEYKPKFYFGGFKYIEIFGDVEVIELKSIAIYSDIKETSSFECSNELINKFYKNTNWSLKSNSIDIPTDCPTRERMGWTGDSQIFFNTASIISDYASFSRKHVLDIFDRQWKNGKIAQIVPFSNEDWFMNPMNGSVGWADAAVLIPYRYYQIYNDDRLLRKYFPNILKYAHFMISRCGREKGIYSIYAKRLHLSKENKKYQVNTGQSYGEWAEPADVKPFVWTDFCEPHPEESMAYTVYILNLVLEIEKIIGRSDDEELLTKYRDGVKKAYQELVTKDKYSLDTDRQAKLVRPIYFNLLDENQTKFAKERLIKALDNYKWRLGTGFLSTPFILDVLKEISPSYAMKLLLNEEMPGWLFMAKHDTGTIWEGWEGPCAQSGIASLNHYSKGAMVEWLFKSLLGIKVCPNNIIIIEPLFVKELNYYKGSYKSIYGLIEVSIENNNVTINIPGNVNSYFNHDGKKEELKPGNNKFSI